MVITTPKTWTTLLLYSRTDALSIRNHSGVRRGPRDPAAKADLKKQGADGFWTQKEWELQVKAAAQRG